MVSLDPISLVLVMSRCMTKRRDTEKSFEVDSDAWA